MSRQKSPRYQGKITAWKDEQGFGFITPNGGGPAVFVHITAFSDRGSRPADNAVVTFNLGVNEKGKQRAENVAYVRNRPVRESASASGTIPLLIAAIFVGIAALAVLAGKLPLLVLGFYLGMSALAFIAYTLDKSAARNHEWRTKESTLHLIGLAGGWPGAVLAQQLLRHKSKKEAFQVTFWATVILNCGAFVWLLLASGANTLRMLIGTASAG